MPRASVVTIAKIGDTVELILQEEEVKVVMKVNKWHEKFAGSRGVKKG